MDKFIVLISTGPGGSSAERGYEKDIRDIVDYFERNCATKDHHRDNSNRLTGYCPWQRFSNLS